MTPTYIEKNDFIEIKYTGYANKEIFDTNIEEDLNKLNPDLKPQKTIIVVGQEMVVHGLDEKLIGREIGKQYEIIIKPIEAFGERKRELIKTISLKAFTEKNVSPKPGMVLTLDNFLVKIIAVSGARVVTDFNNPLAGKEISYKFIIVRKLIDEKEKIESLFKIFFKFIPEFKIKEKIVVKGHTELELFIKTYSQKFREIIGRDLLFEEKKIVSKETTDVNSLNNQ